MSKNSTKVVLDLCGGTGCWSKPYREAGYDVRIITAPEYDVRVYQLPDEPIYGILAAPPCTEFSIATLCRGRKLDWEGGLRIVNGCIRIVQEAQLRSKLAFWALENPKGFLRRFLGKPPLTFNPCDYGDPFTKATDLWGFYNLPLLSPVEPTYTRFGHNDSHLPKVPKGYVAESYKAARRAMTPAGFANAFFKANR